MQKEDNARDIQGIIKRRKKTFLSLFFLVFVAGLIVALALPPVYKSEAIIQVEEQEVKENFAQAFDDVYVEERIKKIHQSVLSRARLREIIETYDPYPAFDDESSPVDLVRKMRDDIFLETVVSDMASKPKGRNVSFTVAFNLSYQGEDPVKVQQITDTLAHLYILEDKKNREKVVSDTNEFLTAELRRLDDKINLYEKQISEFKQNHLRELPSETGYNLQAIAKLERKLEDIQFRLRNLKEKRLFLKAQLANVEPLTPIVIEGEKMAMNPSQRLKELNLQLTKLRSIYSEKHPDIKKLKSEIRDLETQVRMSDSSVLKVKKLKSLENRHAALKTQYGPNHPDVRAVEREIAVLKADLDLSVDRNMQTQIATEKPDNPTYINLTTQINAVDIEIQNLQAERKNVENSIAVYQKRIEKAPYVEKELNKLTRDYETVRAKYNEINNQLMNAEFTQQMEEKSGSTRFSISSPAYLPRKPFKPERLAIILVGLLVAVGFSSLITAFQESLDTTVKSADEITQITGTQVFSAISFVETPQEKKIRHLKTFAVTAGIGCVACLLLYYVHQNVMPLGELVNTIEQRIGQII